MYSSMMQAKDHENSYQTGEGYLSEHWYSSPSVRRHVFIWIVILTIQVKGANFVGMSTMAII